MAEVLATLAAIRRRARCLPSNDAADGNGQRTMLSAAQVQLDGVQAMLAFNRLREQRKLQSMLAKGWVNEAATKIDIQIRTDKKLLAGFFKGPLDQGTIKYVADRDPELIGELKSFKSKYGHSWQEPTCNR